MQPKHVITESIPYTIFIAGDYEVAKKVLEKYCDEVGFCVTAKATTYIYRHGTEEGIEVGLINYPRFPNNIVSIREHAVEIAKELLVQLDQQSFSIQGPEITEWYSYRKEDITDLVTESSK